MKRTRKVPHRTRRAMKQKPAIGTSVATLPTPIERALIQGDLSTLTADERIAYYRAVCRSLGLNPLTRPFDYLTLNQKLVLYARRDCADQLRQSRNVRIEILERAEMNGLAIVRVRASLPNGRADEALGAVVVKGLTGLELANALMKAETKAKRRATLSICGLGMLDESEIEGLQEQTFSTSAPVLNPEDVMPRRKPPEGEAGVPATQTPPTSAPPAQVSEPEPEPVISASERKGSPAAERGERQTEPAGFHGRESTAGQSTLPLAPSGGTIVEISGRQVATGGITKPTLLKIYKLGAQLDELTSKGQAKELLGREYGLEHRHELNEEVGQKYLAELVKRVNKALETRR